MKTTTHSHPVLAAALSKFASLSMLPVLLVFISLFPNSARSSPGILNTGSVALNAGDHLTIEIDGTTVGTQYSQLNVTGTVTLNGPTLDLLLGFTPSPGDMFTIINNDLSDPIAGTFSGLPEGATFSTSGDFFDISYTGGTGNDVVLTAIAAPTPDSGSSFGLLLLSLIALSGASRFRSLRLA